MRRDGNYRYFLSVGAVAPEKKRIIDAVDQIRKAKEIVGSSDYDSQSPDEILVSWVLDQVEVINSRGLSEDVNHIARNLLTKVERYKQGPIMQEVLNFLTELMEISGTATDVFPSLYALLKKYKLNTNRITDLEFTIRYLEEFDIDWSKVTIDFAFGRGLEYYTGIIFEIHCDSEMLGKTQTQVCGGGRYDTLIGDIGGREDVPALGFSFGLERLVLAMQGGDLEELGFLDVLVAPIGDEDEFHAALRLSCRLREQNFRTIVGSKSSNAKAHTRIADRLHVPFIIYLGENEMKNNSVTLKDLGTGKQLVCTFDEAMETIQKGVKKK